MRMTYTTLHGVAHRACRVRSVIADKPSLESGVGVAERGAERVRCVTGLADS